jgi:hypothetical protein
MTDQTGTRAAAVHQAASIINAAARAKLDAEPRHDDFCSLALAVEQVLDALFVFRPLRSRGQQQVRHVRLNRPI